ncbi:hypothetical protein [Streptomyces sp. NPDC051776]|uniref:Rv1733c family protein n=1 Tax=Streptomyces sp. NPDC051776 TaxID=3155414 RepID=UPI003429166F
MNAEGPPYASGPGPFGKGHSGGHEDPHQGPNPLVRRSDRVQAWVGRLILLLFVLGLPTAALAAGMAVHASEMRTVHAQEAERHQVTARLTSDPDVVGAAEPDTGDDLHHARVGWTEKDGTQRTGTARVPPDAHKDSTVRIWVDRGGGVTTPPMTSESAAVTAWAAGGVTAGAVVVLAIGARSGLRWVLDRHRYAQWDAEWELLEPHWSRRLREE